MIISSEIKAIRLDINKVIYRFKWEPWRLDPDELKIALDLLKKSYCSKFRKELEKSGITVSEIRKIALDILSKAGEGDKGSVDPAMHGAPHILIDDKGATNIGLWWCDRSNKGKMFTDDLCTEPLIYYGDRRGVALNPWSLSNISNLDTIIDSAGHHKTGVIGTTPFGYSRGHTYKTATYTVTFEANSTTTIYSVIILSTSHSRPDYSSSCGRWWPSPPGTCHGSYYETVYYPVWGFDVSFDIEYGIAYAVRTKLYVP